VAGLREPNPGDQLRESLDWNESNSREVAATLDEAEPEADSTPIFVAEAQVDKVIEIVDELVEVAAEIRNGSLWLHVDEESLKIAHTICDADPRAKNECRALRGN
jgi:hypothetical protein